MVHSLSTLIAKVIVMCWEFISLLCCDGCHAVGAHMLALVYVHTGCCTSLVAVA